MAVTKLLSPRRAPSPRWLIVTITVTLLGTSCGGGDGSGRESMLVFAAASLTDAFTDIAAAFEADHPEVDVDLVYAGSSSLREQIIEGAPADVYASANISNMDLAVDAGEVAAAPRTFASNVLQIAVPASNPGNVEALDDLADPNLLIGLCVATAPCGASAREVLVRAGVAASVDTEEPDVRALLTKIGEGELDAGLVYLTDVIAGGDRVKGIEVPASDEVDSLYSIAITSRSPNRRTAAAFIEFVLSPTGRDILTGYGFGVP